MWCLYFTSYGSLAFYSFAPIRNGMVFWRRLWLNVKRTGGRTPVPTIWVCLEKNLEDDHKTVDHRTKLMRETWPQMNSRRQTHFYTTNFLFLVQMRAIQYIFTIMITSFVFTSYDRTSGPIYRKCLDPKLSKTTEVSLPAKSFAFSTIHLIQEMAQCACLGQYVTLSDEHFHSDERGIPLSYPPLLRTYIQHWKWMKTALVKKPNILTNECWDDLFHVSNGRLAHTQGLQAKFFTEFSCHMTNIKNIKFNNS